MAIETPKIPLKTYRFIFSTQTVNQLPRYPGSAWRGALGHSLKKTVCVVRNTPCNQCLLKTACAYTYIFETPPPPDAEKMRKYNAAPHPFVLRFPQKEATDHGHYALDVVLFGHGQRYFPYLVHALQRAGEEGIGGHRQKFTLTRIDEVNFDGQSVTIYRGRELLPQSSPEIPLIPPMPETIEILFHTPTRMKHDNKNITEREFSFGAFFNTLLRRISMITYFHTDMPLDIDFAACTTRARSVELISKQLEWFDWTRYSSRQDTEMNMGGVIGKIGVAMQNLDEFWPYLWLGQWTHVGKGTSMGMGAYSIRPTSLSNQ